MDVRSGDVDLHLRARYTHCITFKIHYISNAVCHRAYSPFAMHFWKKKLRKCQNVDNQPRVEWWKLNFLFEFVCLWNQNDLFIFCVYIIVVVAIVILSIITKIACIYLCIFIHVYMENGKIQFMLILPFSKTFCNWFFVEKLNDSNLKIHAEPAAARQPSK